MNHPFAFPKKEKLTGKLQIDRLFNEGRSFAHVPFRIYFRIFQDENDKGIRVLIAVPKKKLSLAVDRNRVKRLIRESYRLQKAVLSMPAMHEKSLHIGIVYTGDQADPGFALVKEKISGCLLKLKKLIEPGT